MNKLSKEQKQEIIAYEAFIRRAATISDPSFMLKGSYVGRQFFANPMDRIPGDMDWVHIPFISDHNNARKTFDDWLIRVTEVKINDEVKFQSFTKNQFWRRIDYAMSDDFPTVNTDLTCWVDGEITEIYIDVSFNLHFDPKPAELRYKPYRGNSFNISYTVPLCLQISWKIHQTLVRPRFKDLFDLIHLLAHPDFNETVLHQTIDALLRECKDDQLSASKVLSFFHYNFSELFEDEPVEKEWSTWRYDSTSTFGTYLLKATGSYITDLSKVANSYNEFFEELEAILIATGFGTPEVMENINSYD